MAFGPVAVCSVCKFAHWESDHSRSSVRRVKTGPGLRESGEPLPPPLPQIRSRAAYRALGETTT
jgi:hypothetical protein